MRNAAFLAALGLLAACGEKEKGAPPEARPAAVGDAFAWLSELLPEGALVHEPSPPGTLRGRLDLRALGARLGPLATLLGAPDDVTIDARMDEEVLRGTVTWTAGTAADDVSDLASSLTRDYPLVVAAHLHFGPVRSVLVAGEFSDRGVAGVVVARVNDPESALADLTTMLETEPRLQVARSGGDGLRIRAADIGIDRFLGPGGEARVRLLAGPGLVAAVVNGDDGLAQSTQTRLRDGGAAPPGLARVLALARAPRFAFCDVGPWIAPPDPTRESPPSLQLCGRSEGPERRVELAFDTRVVSRIRTALRIREADAALRALHRDVRFAVTSGAAPDLAAALAATATAPDPWGGPYELARIRGGRFRVWSRGPDGAADTEDDVSYPAAPEPLGAVAPDAGRRWLERYLAAWRDGATGAMWSLHSEAAREERLQLARSRAAWEAETRATAPGWTYQRERVEDAAVVVTVVAGDGLPRELVLVRESGALVLAAVPD